MTSARLCNSPPIWKQGQAQGLKESRLTIRGTRVRALSPLRRLGQVFRHIHAVTTTLLVRVQRSRKDMWNAVEGPSTRYIVLSMNTGS